MKQPKLNLVTVGCDSSFPCLCIFLSPIEIPHSPFAWKYYEDASYCSDRASDNISTRREVVEFR